MEEWTVALWFKRDNTIMINNLATMFAFAAEGGSSNELYVGLRKDGEDEFQIKVSEFE